MRQFHHEARKVHRYLLLSAEEEEESEDEKPRAKEESEEEVTHAIFSMYLV